MNIFQWKHPAAKWAALGFVLLFTALFVNQCRAEQWEIAVGEGTGQNFNPIDEDNAFAYELMVLSDNGHWTAAVGHIGEQYSNKVIVQQGYRYTYTSINPYSYATAAYRVNLPVGESFDFYMGLGASYRSNAAQVEKLLPSALNFSLEVGATLFDRWTLRARHFSNAGTNEPNRGQNILLLGYRF